MRAAGPSAAAPHTATSKWAADEPRGAAPSAVPPRMMPTAYQPRSLGGPLPMPLPSGTPVEDAARGAASADAHGAGSPGGLAWGGAGERFRDPGGYGCAGWGVGGVGGPQPLVYSVGCEVRLGRAGAKP